MQAMPLIQALELQTGVLPELRAFYRDTLGLTLLEDTAQHIRVVAGGSRITFRQVEDGTQPFYHIAFNIPEHRLGLAKAWLSERVPLLRHAETGDEVIYFDAWDAHALYFYDPAGSLLELIARHTLPTPATGPFGPDDLLYVSEIALRAPDQVVAAERIRGAFGLTHYQEQLAFLGDERGLLVLSPPGRLWIPEFRKAGITAPTRITLAGHGSARLVFPDAPFELIGAESPAG